MEFQNGKIYTIRSHQTNKYYIGSTNHKTLAQRLGKHRSNYKEYLNNHNNYISSFEILQHTDHYIELLELYPCNTKDELRRREGELIKQFRSDLVNICIPGVPYEEEKPRIIRPRVTERNCLCGLTIPIMKYRQHTSSVKHIKLLHIKQLFINELTFYNF